MEGYYKMEELNTISNGEWAILQCMWNSEYATLASLTRDLKDSRNWTNRAIQMMLSRMIAKELVKSHREFRPIRYTAIVDKDVCVRRENGNFLNKVYLGDKAKMFETLLNECSKEELAEVKKLIDAK